MRGQWSINGLESLFIIILEKVEGLKALDDPMSDYLEYDEKVPFSLKKHINNYIYKDSMKFERVYSGKFATAKELADRVFQKTETFSKPRKMDIILKQDKIQIKLYTRN